MADPVDGGAAVAAPRKRSHRLRYSIIALLCIGAVVWMLVLMQRNVVFFKTVSQAVADREQDGTRDMRIGGAVVPGSIDTTADGAEFELTQGGVTVRIDHHGSEPALFEDCAPVVAVGHWEGTTFRSGRIIIKHGNEYEPPADARRRCPANPFANST
jgi:cytochrome c-type biogenesis protein CcmE